MVWRFTARSAAALAYQHRHWMPVWCWQARRADAILLRRMSWLLNSDWRRWMLPRCVGWCVTVTESPPLLHNVAKGEKIRRCGKREMASNLDAPRLNLGGARSAAIAV